MPIWDELFKQEKFRLKNVNDCVVALVPMLKERGARRVLDLGCGAGRHTVYLAREGFEVCGVDLARSGLANTREWLVRENLVAELKSGDIEQIPYPNESFDAVIAVYVIYHKTFAGMQRVLAEIHRVMKAGGLGLVSFQSKRGHRYRRGEEIEPDTFLTDIGPDAGELHHYSDLTDIDKLLGQFVVRKVELEERTEAGQLHSHWQVLFEKK